MLHVPNLPASMVAFAVSALWSGLYLWRRRPHHDDRRCATEPRLLFLWANATGSICQSGGLFELGAARNDDFGTAADLWRRLRCAQPSMIRAPR